MSKKPRRNPVQPWEGGPDCSCGATPTKNHKRGCPNVAVFVSPQMRKPTVVTERRWGVLRDGKLWHDFGFPDVHPSLFAGFKASATEVPVEVTLSYTLPKEGTRVRE